MNYKKGKRLHRNQMTCQEKGKVVKRLWTLEMGDKLREKKFYIQIKTCEWRTYKKDKRLHKNLDDIVDEN